MKEGEDKVNEADRADKADRVDKMIGPDPDNADKIDEAGRAETETAEAKTEKREARAEEIIETEADREDRADVEANPDRPVKDGKNPNPTGVRRLNWVDCLLAVAAVALTFALSNIAIEWIAGRWGNRLVLIYLSGFITQMLFFLFIWGIKKSRGWSWQDLGHRPVAMKKTWGKILSFYAISWGTNLIYVFYLVYHGYTFPETDTYAQLLGQTNWLLIVLNIVLTAVIAPLVEETLFRGIIYQSLSAHFGKGTAAILSSAFFSAVHFQAYGFVPRFILGLMLVSLFRRYKSLYPSMALHALNNLIAVVLSAWAV